MASLEKTGIPGIECGILRPAMAHKFRVMLDKSELICRQVTKTAINMLDRTITVTIEQPIGLAQEMINEIDRLCHRSSFPEPAKFPFSIDLLDGGAEVHSQVYGFAHVLKHDFILDYADGDTASHVLVLKYTKTAQ